MYDIVQVEPVGGFPVEKLSEEVMKESRRVRKWLVSWNSLVKISDRLIFPGIWLTLMMLLCMFLRTKFSLKSIQRIFLVVVPLDHCIAPWLSFLIWTGSLRGMAKSRNRRRYSKTSLVVSEMLWTSAWHELRAVSLWWAQPHIIGATSLRTNHLEIERSVFGDCSGGLELGFITEASMGPQFVSQ